MKMLKKILLMTFTIMIILTMTITAYAANTPLDGTYNVGITLTGGSGKASVKSPTSLTVSGGKMTAKIIFSSSNYTYMIVDGAYYYNTAATGANSTFTIPISALDTAINVTACTEAMSTPHEVDYTIKLSSTGTISKDSGASQNTDKNTNQNTNQGTTQTTVKDSNNSQNTTVKDAKSGTTKEVKKDSESSKPAGDTDSTIKNEEVTEANTTEKVEKNLIEPSKTEELEKGSVEVQESSSKGISGLTKAIIGVVVIIVAIATVIILKKRK